MFFITRADRAVSEFVQRLRFQPLTWFMIRASEWWVKWLVIGGLGGLADLRRRAFPWTALWATAAAGVASGLTTLIKDAVGRARPWVADPAIHAVPNLPGGWSFPSGHASTAFAAATVVAFLRPGLRWWVISIAALVAASRVYLGYHFTSDVLAGAVLGVAVGLLTAFVGPLLAARAARARARSSQVA
jgi:undecaprenyl-diphosphatase